MKDQTRFLLNRNLEEIRSQEIAPERIEQSAQRVRAALFQVGETGWERGPAAERAIGPISGCADFQALIPAFLAHRLPEARTLLLEDHVRECVACRRALHQARQGTESAVSPAAPRVKPHRHGRLMLAGATVVAFAALIVIAGIEGVLPGLWTGEGAGATVESVNGSLYAVSGQGSRPISPGAAIAAGEELRTGPDATARIRFSTGTRIELGMRADLDVTRGWLGAAIHLAQGSIIVEAGGRDSGHLSVTTRDCLISDQGTIFAVSESVKGSRVSVIQGQVRVKAGGQSETVHAGGQLAVGSSLAPIPIREQISWSRDSGRYLALLAELAGMERELRAMPGPPPRFNSELIKYVPENTVVYAAIPNLESTLANIDVLLKEHMAKSILLREWWQKQQASGSALRAQEILQRVEACSGYLGNEIVFAAAKGTSGALRPVVLAQVAKAGFREFLDQQMSAIHSQKGGAGIRVIDNASELPPPSVKSRRVFILLQGDLMAASSDTDALRKIAALIGSSHSSGFSGSDFYSAIEGSYRSGAGWLLAVNLEQIPPQSVHTNQMNGVADMTGLANVKYLFAESKDLGRKPENRVTISFAGKRQGLASWLAAPGPMGTMDFVSPQASFALSFVLRNPKTLVEESLSRAGRRSSDARQGLRWFESQTGVSLEDDLAGSLGGEVTVAQDGPLLPAPGWLVAMDVYNPERLEAALEKLVNALSQRMGPNAQPARLTHENAGGRVYYDLHLESAGRGPSQGQAGPLRLTDIHYTFADGYWLLASSRAELDQAIQNRKTGYTLASSQGFQEALPKDGNAYFSALLYENFAEKLGPLLQDLPGGEALSQEFQQDAAPVMIGAYGEPDRIIFVSNESPLGLGANSIVMAADALLHLRRPGGRPGAR